MTDTQLTKHPQPMDWDRLRAGLLDNKPKEKQDLEQHLSDCAHCQKHLHDWQNFLRAAANGDPNPSQAGALQARRRVALTRQQARQISFWNTPGLAMAASLIIVALGMSLFLDWPTPPTDKLPVSTALSDAGDPDLYADIDFYLWLSNQAEKKHEPSDHS